MPQGVWPCEQLFSVPIGLLLLASAGCATVTGPENVTGVVTVTRRLNDESMTWVHEPSAFWTTSTTVTPCPAMALATFSRPAASFVMTLPCTAV